MSNKIANIAAQKKIALIAMAKRDYHVHEPMTIRRTREEKINNDLCDLFNGWPLKLAESTAVAKILMDDPEYVRMAQSFDQRHDLANDRDSSVLIMTQRYLDGDDFDQ